MVCAGTFHQRLFPGGSVRFINEDSTCPARKPEPRWRRGNPRERVRRGGDAARGGEGVVMATGIAVSRVSLVHGTLWQPLLGQLSSLFSVSRLWKSSLCSIAGVTETLWLDRLQSLECGFSLWSTTHRCMSSDYNDIFLQLKR